MMTTRCRMGVAVAGARPPGRSPGSATAKPVDNDATRAAAAVTARARRGNLGTRILPPVQLRPRGPRTEPLGCRFLFATLRTPLPRVNPRRDEFTQCSRTIREGHAATTGGSPESGEDRGRLGKTGTSVVGWHRSIRGSL